MIPATVIRQRDFTGGQQDKENERRDDQQATRSSCRRLENFRPLAAGGARRRPGKRQEFLSGGMTLVVRPTTTTKFYFSLEAATLTIRDSLKQVRHTFTGEAWTADEVYDLSVQVVANASLSRVYVAGASRPRVVTYDDDADTWSIDDYAFLEDSSGATREPFYRFAALGITVQPSARTGAITLTASASAFLTAAHVGNRIRYAGKQIEITSVTNGTSAAGTVIEELPPSFEVTVGASGGFQVGDVVEGRTSGAQGHVTSIPSSTKLRIVCTSNYSGFSASEILVGPNGQTTVSSQTGISPEATSVWDEAFITDYRGWPASLSYDVQRLIMCRFPQLGRAVLWSAIGEPSDFRVGSEADEAIFELVPENCTVQSVAPGADEFVLTDVGCYYIPISGSSPLQPGSVEFRLISSDAASKARPAQTSEGLAFINYAQTRVLAIIGTGQTARPYIVQDTSENHFALIDAPVCIVSSTGETRAPERYVYVVNADGTLAVGRYNARSDFAGWVPWTSEGTARWASIDRGDVLVMSTYALESGDREVVEIFDEDRKLDSAVTLYLGSGADILELTTGEPLELYGGGYLELGGRYQTEFLAGEEVHVFDGAFYRGTVDVEDDGSLAEDLDTDGYQPLYVGLNFEPVYEPFVPSAPEGQSVRQTMRRRRIKQIAIRVQDSNGYVVSASGYRREIPAYRPDENEEIAAVLRDETQKFRVLGRDYEPSVEVRQTVPGEFTLIEFGMEVTV